MCATNFSTLERNCGQKHLTCENKTAVAQGVGALYTFKTAVATGA